MSNQVKMYSTRFCPYCTAAKSLLDDKNVAYEDIAVDGRNELRQQMVEASGRNTVPQIWIGDTHIGGFDDLNLLNRQGQLDTMLQAS
ncbi:MAG: glutaredoxin 3 [Halioglobus sp.]|jgi:glutaredoxin 3